MGIKAIFRVQCDGPCEGWLSDPHAAAAAVFPGERAARNAALAAGWSVRVTVPVKVWCPDCTLNPFGIRLPPDRCNTCGHAHRGVTVCRHPSGGYPCLCMNERTT